MTDIEVDPAQLRMHTRNVTAAADGIRDAADAAETVAMNGEAFGLLVGFVGSWFQEKEADLALTYRDAVNGLRADAANLMTSAEDYENADQSAAARLTSSSTRQRSRHLGGAPLRPRRQNPGEGRVLREAAPGAGQGLARSPQWYAQSSRRS